MEGHVPEGLGRLEAARARDAAIAVTRDLVGKWGNSAFHREFVDFGFWAELYWPNASCVLHWVQESREVEEGRRRGRR